MSRHSMPRPIFTGVTERTRLRGSAPRIYVGQTRAPERSGSPLVMWAILVLVALLILVLFRL